MFQLYLDPGSRSFFIQHFIAAIAGMSIAIGANWSKIKCMLGKEKNKVEQDDEDDNEPHPVA
jgi:hypothetical protein